MTEEEKIKKMQDDAWYDVKKIQKILKEKYVLKVSIRKGDQKMTSKEALNDIRNILQAYFSMTDEKVAEELNVVEKDLDLLEKHKDIEQELGIDLLVLFKALKRGFWYKTKGQIEFCTYAGYQGSFIYVRDNDLNDMYFIKDYGKTWALTKGELEK